MLFFISGTILAPLRRFSMRLSMFMFDLNCIWQLFSALFNVMFSISSMVCRISSANR